MIALLLLFLLKAETEYLLFRHRFGPIAPEGDPYYWLFRLLLDILLISAILLLLHWMILKPLTRFLSHIQTIRESGETHFRYASKRADEIGVLAAEFNRMLDRLDQQRAVCRESEAYYQSVLRSMNDEIVILDRNYDIVDMNRDYLASARSARKDAIGKPCKEIFTCLRGLFEERDEVLQAVFRSGRFRSIRHEWTETNGRKGWKDLLISPLSLEEESVTHIIIAARDITHEVLLENRLRHAQKMEAIGTLAGGIAHDFNNILMTIMMNTEFVLRKWEGSNGIRESLDLSLRAAYRARDLVEQILTFSRKEEQKKSPLIIGPIIKESIKMLRASLPATVEIRQNIEPETGAVLGNPVQIQQVLINLCSNAAHAMRRRGGVLTVELSRCRIEKEEPLARPHLKPGRYLRLGVVDTGEGMSQERIDQIFQPFFTTKPPGEGTGMGLAMVHSLIEGMGGAVKVESRIDQGSRFDVYFPEHEGTLSEEASEAFSPAPPGEGRILVIDDEAPVVRIIGKLLTESGYTVTGETDGLAALNRFRKNPDSFDLVVTDQTMPGATGIELSREMLALRPDLPIVLCTGFSEIISREEALQQGIREFVMKPITSVNLTEIIGRILTEK